MQVYFIDNEEYFKRKFTYTDADKYFEDNDERTLFFSKGAIDTAEKLESVRRYSRSRLDVSFGTDVFEIVPKREPYFQGCEKLFSLLTITDLMAHWVQN